MSYNYNYESPALQPGGIGYDPGYDPIFHGITHEKELDRIFYPDPERDKALQEIFRRIDEGAEE